MVYNPYLFYGLQDQYHLKNSIKIYSRYDGLSSWMKGHSWKTAKIRRKAVDFGHSISSRKELPAYADLHAILISAEPSRIKTTL